MNKHEHELSQNVFAIFLNVGIIMQHLVLFYLEGDPAAGENEAVLFR